MLRLLRLRKQPVQVQASTVNGYRRITTLNDVPNPLPATFVRGGTSKGVFINRSILPAAISEWSPIFLGIMGSPDPEYGRQLNGMGGGVSSLSKICVVGKPPPNLKADGIDAGYTFVQVGIRDATMDTSGNCGNLSSMIGVFAVDEGICRPRLISPNTARVQSFNLNTSKRLDTTFPISDNGVPVLDLPQTSIAGVPGEASRILMDCVDPSGARTGKLLPTGNPTDVIKFSSSSGATIELRLSLVDATNPTVFISMSDLREATSIPTTINFSSRLVEETVEVIRRKGAEMMGLDPHAPAQPKIAVLDQPITPDADIVINAFSMGILHKAVPMTVGLCLGVAANIEGTLAWDIVRPGMPTGMDDQPIRIKHPAGVVEVGAEFGLDGKCKTAKVVRTGRRLMKGVVWW